MMIRDGASFPLFGALALFSLGSNALPSSAQTNAPPPAAVWHFDEGAGKTAADATDPANTGTLIGDAQWVTPGKTGAALRLSGAGSVDIPRPVVDTSGSFTVSAWVRVNTAGGFQTFASIDGTAISGFFLQLRDDTKAFAFAVPAADDIKSVAVVGAGFPAQVGVWYHLIGVRDAAAKTISLYINGVLQATTPCDSAWSAQGHTLIGRAKFDGKPVDYCRADIDDMRFTASAGIDTAEMQRIARETGADLSSLTIDATQPTRPLSPMLYGLMIEDINYSIDGGLYAELIRNRAFKDAANPDHWSLFPATGAGKISLDTTQPISGTVLTTSLRLDSDTAQGAAVANDGYFGIPVTPRTRYRARFYAKSTGAAGPLTVSLQSVDGRTAFAHAVVKKISPEWKQYEVTLKTGKVAPSTQNRLVIAAHGTGTVWLNQVSLFPPTWNRRPNGARKDLMRLLADMKPAFLRLPGGNYLEGNTIAERFDWKATRRDIAQRPGHPDPWGYRSDDGFGLLEYLEWCEDLRMEPVLAVFAGYALRGEHIAAGSALQPFVQDALDEIEYVTGSVETPNGALRAKDGHPAPFPLTYVEVGNEDQFDRSGSYEGRFAAFYDAIKARYPRLQIIATDPVKSRKPDMLDEHFYRPAGDMASDAHHYDAYDRSGPKIFVGEWASQDVDKPWEKSAEKGPTPTLSSALGDAAWMTGMERNSDLVLLSSYAPLMVNVNPGGRQWAINLIGFDGLSSYGSPSYYAQKMFSRYHGDRIVETRQTGLNPLYYTVSRDSKRGTLYIKVVNRSAVAQPVRIAFKGVALSGKSGEAITLSSTHPSDTNTLTDPVHVVPVTTAFSAVAGDGLRYTFAPFSVTVLALPAR